MIEIPVSTYKPFTPVARVVWLFALVLLTGCDEQQISSQASKHASSPSPDSTLPAGIQLPVSRQTQNSHLTEVRVLPTRPGTHRASISAYGEVEPRYRLNLDAQVSGRVVGLAKAFEVGAMVSEGQLLVRLDDTEYRADLMKAQQQLMSARIHLAEVQEQARQRRSDWQTSGLSDDHKMSALASGIPQLELARIQLASAQADLELAGLRLESTRIRAPFDGLVVARQVSPGSLLEEGDTVATLFNMERVEIAVALSDTQWMQFAAESGSQPDELSVEVGALETHITDFDPPSWTGYLLRVNRHLDANTRQRTLVVAVDQPLQQTPPLLPGRFVSVMLEGQPLTGIWRVPASAVTPSGQVWEAEQVSGLGRLRSLTAEIVFRQEQDVFIRIPDVRTSDISVQLLTHPLASYLEGMAVNPVVDSELSNRYPLPPAADSSINAGSVK